MFVGNSLALDLANTEVVFRGTRRDLLAVPADAEAWWDAARAAHPEARLPAEHPMLDGEGDALLRALLDLRRAIRAVCEAVLDEHPIREEDLALLNRILGAGFVRLDFESGHPRLATDVRDAGLDGLLFPIARSAAELLSGREPRRLHRCGNERCILLFYDTTKSGTRRWCSVGCMDRARSVRRHRQHQNARNPSSASAEEGFE